MSGVIRTSVRSRLRWRMISCPAATGIRWVKPSSATVSPSLTRSATASAREVISACVRIDERWCGKRTVSGMLSRHAHPGGDRRRRARGADARPAARAARDRVRDHRARATASTSSSACARACSSRRRWTCWTRSAWARGCTPRGSCTTGVELRFDGEGHRIASERPDRRARDHDLRAAGGRQGPDRGAAGLGSAAVLRGLRRRRSTRRRRASRSSTRAPSTSWSAT